MRARFGLLILCIGALGAQGVFPGKEWEKAGKPEAVGFSGKRLSALTPLLQTLDTSAMMVVSGGRLVYEYGDLQKVSYLASCRKSVMAMLYGNYIASGRISLGKTLREMDIDDIGGLLPVERNATVEDLLTARSGVYHPASNGGDASEFAPPRGTQKPGTWFLYNNWDFNAAGTVFEKLTGRDIYDALESDLAKPIGMQDFDRALHKKSGDLKASVHPAYHMHFSTRDMARVGYLMLRQGNWNGRQLVPAEWTKKIVSLVTPVDRINPPSWRGYGQGLLWGYGYLWWVWDGHHGEGPLAGAYTAMGAFGQYITVLPALDVVIAHKTVPQATAAERVRQVTDGEYQAVLMHVLAAYCGQHCGK
jgi:CubicO group peptidase (beta-lactamase class C family)